MIFLLASHINTTPFPNTIDIHILTTTNYQAAMLAIPSQYLHQHDKMKEKEEKRLTHPST